MATSYTSLLGFALPVTAELAGAWGSVVNNSITQLAEDSIAGVATASVASGDWTLTTTGSGAQNQARCAILIPTGSPGVSRNVIAPSKSKAYFVVNQSNAAIVVKGSATTGVSIAAGKNALVAWNGSDFVKVASNETVSLSSGVTGTLPIANGGTGNTTIAAKSVFVANALDTLTTVTPGAGQSIRINAGNTAWEAFTPSAGDVNLAADNAFTGANTFYNDTGQTFGAATTAYDGIIVKGRGAGSGSYRVTIVPGTLTSSQTLTLPDASTTVVGTDATQTLTNKTLTDPAIIGTILEDVYTISDGAAFEVDPGNGSIQLITLGANRTPKATNFAAGEAITLMIDDGSGYTITWTDSTWGGSGVVWMTDSGVAPTLSTSGYTTIVLWKVSTQVYGARVGNA